MAKSTLRQTNNTIGVKASGAGSYTFDLQTDLLLASQELDGATQRVNIVNVLWCGAAGSTISVVRNSVTIMNIDAAQSGDLNFNQTEFNENTENSSDIVVTITGDAQLWMTLRKVSGYKTKIQPEQFGSYDNPASSTS